MGADTCPPNRGAAKEGKESDFDFVKGCGFSRAVTITKSAPALQAAEKSMNSGGAVEERRFSAA
jgi:hypothetical protein